MIRYGKQRSNLYNSLIQYNVPDKLIRLIKLTMQGNKMKANINSNYTKWFETKTGDRQGDPLSALLFSRVLDTVFTNLEVRGNIPARFKQICAHADDIVITGRTTQVLTDTFFKIKRMTLKAGLIININKTKYLHCTRKSNQQKYLIAGGERLEQVNWIKYL
jgi:hypothetical protein